MTRACLLRQGAGQWRVPDRSLAVRPADRAFRSPQWRGSPGAGMLWCGPPDVPRSAGPRRRPARSRCPYVLRRSALGDTSVCRRSHAPGSRKSRANLRTRHPQPERKLSIRRDRDLLRPAESVQDGRTLRIIVLCRICHSINWEKEEGMAPSLVLVFAGFITRRTHRWRAAAKDHISRSLPRRERASAPPPISGE